MNCLLLVLLRLQLQRVAIPAESAAHDLADDLVHQEDSKGAQQHHPAQAQQQEREHEECSITVGRF